MKIRKILTLFTLTFIAVLSAISFGTSALAYSDQGISDDEIRDKIGKITIGSPRQLSTPNTLEYVYLPAGEDIPIEEDIWYKSDYYVVDEEVKISEFLSIIDNSENFSTSDLDIETQVSDYFIYFKFNQVDGLDLSEFSLKYAENINLDYAFLGVQKGCETAELYGLAFRETFDERVKNSLNLNGVSIKSVNSEEHPEDFEYVYFENWDINQWQDPQSNFYKVELNVWYRTNIMNVSEGRSEVYSYAYNTAYIRGDSDISSFLILENIYSDYVQTSRNYSVRTLSRDFFVEKTVDNYVYFKFLDASNFDEDVVTIHYDYHNDFLFSPMLRFAICADSVSAERYNLGAYQGYGEDPAEQHYVQIGYRDDIQLNTWYKVQRGYDDYNLLPSSLRYVYKVDSGSTSGTGQYANLYNIFAPTASDGFNEKIFNYETKKNSYLNGVVVDKGDEFIYFKITEDNTPNEHSTLLRFMDDNQVVDKTQGAIYRSNGLLSDFPEEPTPEEPTPDEPTPDEPTPDEPTPGVNPEDVFDKTHDWINSTFNLDWSKSMFGTLLIGVIVVLFFTRKR